MRFTIGRQDVVSVKVTSLPTLANLSEDWRTLARCDLDRLVDWLKGARSGKLRLCVATIIAGVGIYGATVGLWRAPEMALYVAIKLPLVVLATVVLNGVINGMLAQVLGSGMSFGQTLRAILMSFTIFALIVGSLSPLTFFMVMNAPEPDSAAAASSHSRLLVFHVSLIAFAGIVATHRLYNLLCSFSGSRRIAGATLFAWMAGNLFLGAQVAYLLRPIFGTPTLEVEFLRSDPFEGNFYESLWYAIQTF